MSKQNIFIARQPLVDSGQQVVGYELLFRGSDTDVAEIADGDQASAQVIVNSFLNIGIDNLVGSSLAFINVPEQLILNDTMLPMFQEQTVLELLETIRPRPEVLDGIRRLKERGFLIALDDFTFTPDFEPMVQLADFIKIDVLDWDSAQLGALVAQLMPYKARLIAEKVETREKFEECRALGIEWFQGYFFCRPQTVAEKTLPSSKAVVLNLLHQINDPKSDIDQLQTTLSTDAALSYKLLRYVNSAAFGLRREIESLKDAIVLVGLNTIRNWAALILLNSVSTGKPMELMKTAMIRARMCEKLAEKTRPDIKSQMFITGLLSLLDAIMDTSMDTLLDNLALSAPIRFAILNREGAHGALLQQVVWYEQGAWDELLKVGTDRELLVETYLEAVSWADNSMPRLGG